VSTNPSSSARQARDALGLRLRELRQEAGLTGRALATATRQHFTRVSKIEHGIQVPSEQDIQEWCRACGAEDQIPDLLATARAVDSAYVEFRRQARAGMKRVLGAHTDDLYERLLAVMSLPTVSLGIIPMMGERHAVGSAGFWIFDDVLVARDPVGQH
jgi:transcriptional regulator with XRE-family HTH domain